MELEGADEPVDGAERGALGWGERRRGGRLVLASMSLLGGVSRAPVDMSGLGAGAIAICRDEDGSVGDERRWRCGLSFR